MDVLIPKKKWSFVARWWWLGAGTGAASLYWPRPGQRLHMAVSRLTISPVTLGKADYDIGYFGEHCRAPAARPAGRATQGGKWVALLLSTGTGLVLCSRYLPWGLHSVIILLFSTAIGFLAYYLFLRRQAK